VREILTHGSVRGSNAHPRNTHPKAQKQKCGHRAKVESKDCGLVLYSTTDRTGNQNALTERLNSIDFMSYTLEDYQIVLSQSITADRIIKIMPQGNEFGRVLRQKKKYDV